MAFCNNRYIPEVRTEIQDLKKVLKDLEKKKENSKNEFDSFKVTQERPANSFSDEA